MVWGGRGILSAEFGMPEGGGVIVEGIRGSVVARLAFFTIDLVEGPPALWEQACVGAKGAEVPPQQSRAVHEFLPGRPVERIVQSRGRSLFLFERLRLRKGLWLQVSPNSFRLN